MAPSAVQHDPWLVAAMASFRLLDMSGKELRDSRWAALEISRTRWGTTGADRAILSEREDILIAAGEAVGCKLGAVDLQKRLVAAGRKDLARTFESLNQLRRVPAHPGQLLTQVVKAIEGQGSKE